MKSGISTNISDPRLYVRLNDKESKSTSRCALINLVSLQLRQTVYHCTECDLGFDLGMKLVRDRVRRTLTISQPEYLEDLREECGFTSTGPMTPLVDKPWEPESKRNPALDKPRIQLYQSKVGAILW